MYLTVPLIQNLGITILQARNQMKFRSLLYVAIAIASLGISVPLAKQYGGIGCAVGTSLALIGGQIIAMNIYYYKKIHINIPLFWKEIGKMSLAPIGIGVIVWILLQQLILSNWWLLVVSILLFSVCYVPLIWKVSMNDYERNLFGAPFQKVYQKVIRK